MPLYFYLHAAEFFHHRLAPALRASWQRRSFEPLRPLRLELTAKIQGFADRYHLGAERPLLADGPDQLAFDRHTWAYLVGECLLLGAEDVPDVLTAPDSLEAILAAGLAAAIDTPREQQPPIRQAHFGSWDVRFGGYYRPEAAGLNDVADVQRLAHYLATVDPAAWTVERLPVRADMPDADERAEELEFARDCLASLRALYERAAAAGYLIVCEVL